MSSKHKGGMTQRVSKSDTVRNAKHRAGRPSSKSETALAVPL